MGGGGSQPSTMTQTSIPEYAEPYVKAMLGQSLKTVFNIRPEGETGAAPPAFNPEDFTQAKAQYMGAGEKKAEGGILRLASGGSTGNAPNSSVGGFEILGMKPLQQYQGYGADTSRVAGFSPDQGRARDTINSFSQPMLGGAEQMAPEYAALRGRVAQAGLTALNKGAYDPANIQVGYAAGRFSPDYHQGTFAQNSFTDEGMAQKYMNPYMQNVVDINKREAIRDAAKQDQTRQAQAVQAGAFGGGRDALVRAEANRNLQTQLGDIQNTGMNAAFTSAQQQYNTEAAKEFAAQQAREQAKQFGTNASLQAQQMGEQSRQFGAGLNMQGQLASEQSRQFGAGLDNQNLQTALGAGNLYGNLLGAETGARLQAGQQMFDQHKDVVNAQYNMGAQDQAYRQRLIDNQYGDYLTAQNYPYKQLGFLSDMLRGLPLSNTAVYQAPPSTISQIAGLGTAGIAGLGLYNAMR